jgi:hypothetical protein
MNVNSYSKTLDHGLNPAEEALSSTGINMFLTKKYVWIFLSDTNQFIAICQQLNIPLPVTSLPELKKSSRNRSIKMVDYYDK